MATSLTWFGHSNILLDDGSVRVLIDPFFEGNPLAPDWHTVSTPDIIVVTHDHSDHLGQAVAIAKATGATVACIVELAERLTKEGIPSSQIVCWNIDGTVRIKGVSLTMTPAVHSCELGVPVGFVIEMTDGLVLYHAGDTGLFGDMRLIGERFAIDVALLPIGGYYTMDGAQAASACLFLQAAYVVPIHYATFGVLASDAKSFIDALVAKNSPCRPLLPHLNETYMLPMAPKKTKAD